MAGCLENEDIQVAKIDPVSLGEGAPRNLPFPIEVKRLVNVLLSSPFGAHAAEFVDRLNGLWHPENIPTARRGKDLQVRISTFEERNNAHVVEVGMENQKPRNAGFVDAKFLDLFQNLRHEIAQPAADQHGSLAALQEVNARFFGAEKPELIPDLSGFSSSHISPDETKSLVGDNQAPLRILQKSIRPDQKTRKSTA